MQKPPLNWTNVLVFSLTPLAAVTLVPWYGFAHGYDGFEWAMFGALWILCGLSITAGYHRLWSHKTYTAHPVVRLIFALGGACALQHDVLHWASDHRRHHRHVDDDERDPYSAGRGFWFSHMGWILRHYPSGAEDLSNVKDLQRDPIVRWQSRHYLTLVLLMNIGVPVVLGWLQGDVIASLMLAGVLRLVVNHHLTWLINSMAHLWGQRPYSHSSSARDNPLLALLTWGEGYHNYHHTFQWDYRNGIRWWHWDPTKWLIRSLAAVGLAANLKRCSPAEIEAARMAMQYQHATEKCIRLNLPEALRQRVEEEYQQLSQTLKLWAQHRQQWLEARSQRLQAQLEQWDLVQIQTAYQEMHYRLKLQRRRWQVLLASLAHPQFQT